MVQRPWPHSATCAGSFSGARKGRLENEEGVIGESPDFPSL